MYIQRVTAIAVALRNGRISVHLVNLSCAANIDVCPWLERGSDPTKLTATICHGRSAAVAYIRLGMPCCDGLYCWQELQTLT